MIWLSHLGGLVVERFGKELRTGKAIRWAKHRQALQDGTRLSVPDLMKAFLTELEKKAVRSYELAGFLGGCPKPELVTNWRNRVLATLAACEAIAKACRMKIDYAGE
jgi:hypothetical protein